MLTLTAAARCRGSFVGALLSAALLLSGALAPSAAADGPRSEQWYLDAMQADRLWEVSTGKGVKIAVLDSGVNVSAPGLEGQVEEGRDFYGNGGGKGSHGTDMAALIAGTGKNGGIHGLAPGASILDVKIGEQKVVFGDYSKQLAGAIRYATQSDARIINISWGYTDFPEEAVRTIQAAVDEANARGKLIFAGAGNDGDIMNDAVYPAKLPGVVAVAATDRKGTRLGFSNPGAQIALAAPGSDMPHHCDDGRSVCHGSGGTSTATALTSATAALIWSAHPDWTANQVLRVMIETAARPDDKKDAAPSRYIGYGTIRPGQVLLDGRGDPGPADRSPLFAKYYAALEASASPSVPAAPSPSEPADVQASGTAKSDRAAAGGSDSSVRWWVAVGGAAAVLLAGVVAVVFFRRRAGSRTP